MNNESPQIQAIKSRYKNSFPEKAAQIESFVAALNSADEKPERDVIHEYLHKLAGSMGMYGYSNISAYCRKLMDGTQNLSEESLCQHLQTLSELLREQS